MTTLFSSVCQSLGKLIELLNQLDDASYIAPCKALSDSSIGQHTRHIIELFQCLVNQYDTGIVNYDKRDRNRQIETEISFAIACIEALQLDGNKANKDLILQQLDMEIATNYHRELLYNLEHCIHHQALIKVAVLQMEDIYLCPSFGVAPSTLEYRVSISRR